MGGNGMFYVITRKTLRNGLLIILLLTLVLWYAWNSFGRDSVFKSGGGIVLWPKLVPRGEIAGPKEKTVSVEPESPEPDLVEGVGESDVTVVTDRLEPTASGIVEPPTESFVNVGELMDEYLPVSPIYAEDFTLAIPTSGSLVVAVEPLTKRDAFSEFRWERDRSRSRQLETLQTIIQDTSNSEQQKEAAQSRLVDIMAGSEVEMQLEGLLMAQGLPDAVVVLSQAGATIMVDSILTEEEAARIGDTVSGMTGMSLEKIRIIDHHS
jgi:hypothetical protein